MAPLYVDAVTSIDEKNTEIFFYYLLTPSLIWNKSEKMFVLLVGGPPTMNFGRKIYMYVCIYFFIISQKNIFNFLLLACDFANSKLKNINNILLFRFIAITKNNT